MHEEGCPWRTPDIGTQKRILSLQEVREEIELAARHLEVFARRTIVTSGP